MIRIEVDKSEAEAVAATLAGREGAVGRFYLKLLQAIAVERGDGGAYADTGSCMEDLASNLIGGWCDLTTFDGRTIRCRILRLTGFRTLIIQDGLGEGPISLSLVKSIKPMQEEAA